LGIDAFTTWQVSGTWALVVMFLFTASAHFTKTKQDFIAMAPKAFPFSLRLVPVHCEGADGHSRRVFPNISQGRCR
jgi:hypothetical protein